eukprot:Filipodium_phascolosomae@DN2867_c0_g1_i1.p1
MVQLVDQVGPCVVMAAPAMLQSGLSRDLLELWAPDPANCVIITGYSVRSTLAYEMVNSSVTKFQRSEGSGDVELKCEVLCISFSAHADYQQNQDFICKVKAQTVVLVHGERNKMELLAEKLRETLKVHVHTPATCQPILLDLSSVMENVPVQVAGSLAKRIKAHANRNSMDSSDEKPKEDTSISLIEPISVLMDENSGKVIAVSPEEMHQYTNLQQLEGLQSTERMYFPYSFELLRLALIRLFDPTCLKIVRFDNGCGGSCSICLDPNTDSDGLIATVSVDEISCELCVCWNELQMGAYMVSQAVILEAVAILKEPDFAQGMLLASASQLNKDSEEHTIGCMVALLRGLYGEHAVSFMKETAQIRLKVPLPIKGPASASDIITPALVPVCIDFPNRFIHCSNQSISESIQNTLSVARFTLT